MKVFFCIIDLEHSLLRAIYEDNLVSLLKIEINQKQFHNSNVMFIIKSHI